MRNNTLITEMKEQIDQLKNKLSSQEKSLS